MEYYKIIEKLEKLERLVRANKSVLTLEETCEYMGISKSYLYKLTAQGVIPYSKPNGKLIYFSKEKLDRWLLQNSTKSTDEIKQEALRYTLKRRR
ncbi:helix-turn-helix domain-containing protein [Robertkochia solimangrovi]|uniref:helix-turn-helix domain-containing protein n=1 Tax=Robertkochia solimangrovi TaxID=2213046 RepID=UPI00117D8E64|nr:helix-turn-helix domain-containing protein [Robertkochia solimangrovi]TRZ45134.1 DNA-binding protein [Robertkochia solimangrovi]